MDQTQFEEHVTYLRDNRPEPNENGDGVYYGFALRWYMLTEERAAALLEVVADSEELAMSNTLYSTIIELSESQQKQGAQPNIMANYKKSDTRVADDYAFIRRNRQYQPQ